jgi:DNA polymerase (family 10)
MLDRHQIAASLRELGVLLQAKGENPFKIRAYETAARALDGFDGDLGALVDEKRLTEIPGVGEAIAAKITELWRDGRLSALEKLREEVPRGFPELMRVPELGPKRVMALFQGLGIENVDQLEKACKEGRVHTLKGFSEKLEAKILEGIAAMRSRKERLLLYEAREVGERIVSWMRGSPAVQQVELAGSARRWRETVGDLDLVVASADPDAAMDRFVALPEVRAVEERGDTKCSVRLNDGLQVDLRVVPVEDWWTALHHFTGSKAHHVRLRGRARERGLTLSEWGLQRIEGGGKLPIGSEAEIYAHLGLTYVPPELREDEGEIEAAEAGDTFADLLTTEDLRGVVHCHTVYSDGKNTIEEMATAAQALGYAYLTITDHSPAAFYANGVEVDRLKKQWDEIDRVQEKVGIKLLKGVESDILEDGALDYPDSVIEGLDVVIASVHNRLRLDEDAMTKRLVHTMKLPVFKIWGHALGRLLEQRPPFACRVEEVLDALAASRGAVEINGDPHRLDLEPRWAREARKRKIPFVISADAHAIRHLQYPRFGAAMARRAGVRKHEVLNTRGAAEFAAAVRPV